MKRDAGIIFFGSIEILIGLLTFITVTISLILGNSAKPPMVWIFVLTASVISFSLGIGILRHNRYAYNYLLFFAVIIIISKILIFFKLINLTGALETTIPSAGKNTVSIIYHLILILYFKKASVKEKFKFLDD